MKANYKNWFPLWMVLAIGAGFLVALSLYYVFGIWGLFVSGFTRTVLTYVFGILSLVLLIAVIWAFYAYRAFSYEGGRKLSKEIIDGVSDYVHLLQGEKVGMLAVEAEPLQLLVRGKIPRDSCLA